MKIPSYIEVRKRIELVGRKEFRICLMGCLLFAARISELVAYASPRDTTVARGPKGEDVRLEVFENDSVREDVAIFKISTAKRGGVERLIALPLNKKYEPWTEEIYNYFLGFDGEPVFPFTRQAVKDYVKKNNVFNGYFYPIEKYTVSKNGLTKQVDRHLKPFSLHALRHIRTTDLIDFYGFDSFDLSIYGGWTPKSIIGVGNAMGRYFHLQWRRYFPKLLKERKFI